MILIMSLEHGSAEYISSCLVPWIALHTPSRPIRGLAPGR
jgi:hypothetical protein